MNIINIFHFINIIAKINQIRKERSIKNIINIDFKNDYKKIGNYQKTLFVCTHDYCFVDILASYGMNLKLKHLKQNTYVIVRDSFISSYGKLFPDIKMIERGNNIFDKMIRIFENNENIMIFYSRNHLKYLNIDKIIKRMNINIVPIKITSNTIDPISHNQDGILENIDVYLQNKFSIEILNKINYENYYNKEKFINILKGILYPDNGYFDEEGNFIKNKKINTNVLKYI